MILCVGSDTIGLESPIGAASCLASHEKEKRKRDPNDREPHRESLMDIPHKGERLKTSWEQVAIGDNYNDVEIHKGERLKTPWEQGGGWIGLLATP